jgi:hypothetical protein
METTMLQRRSKQMITNHLFDYSKAVAITPKDDAFHGTMNCVDVEWWYFDAVFDNDYSIFLGIRTIHIGNSGVVMPRFEIYHKGKVEFDVLQTNFFRDFETSLNTPFVKLFDKKVIELDVERYKKTGEWRYNVSFKIGKHAINLTFTGITKGWKIETPKNSWAVALPKAEVTGSITVNGIEIPVKGIGYHDHNWDYSLITTSFSKIGWYWGRIIGSNMNIIWAKTIESLEKSNLLAIINSKKEMLIENEFITINPANISLTVKNFVFDHHRWAPTEFVLQIKDRVSDNSIPVDIDITMKASSSKHSKIFTAHYWRYHVLVTGIISIGSIKEKLKDSPQIVEFLSFKSQGRDQ